MLAQQSESSTVLQEVIVLAPKRASDVQQTGISMSVIDRDSIEAMSVHHLPDLATHIANVELFEDFPGAGIPTWVIRGVGLQDFNSNNTPTAAIYVDEVYQTSTVMGGNGLFDIEQVEVLKGPQGGLYGRNTSGGAVRMQTRRAQLDDMGGYVDIGYGRWGNLSLEGAASFPLSDRQALRISGRSENSDDGWQSSLTNGESWGEKDRWDLRSWYLFQVSDSLSLEWKIQAGEDNSQIALARAAGFYGMNGGYCAAMLQGFRDDDTCLSFAGLNQLLQSQPVDLVSAQSPDGSRVWSDPVNAQSNEYLSNTLYVSAGFDGWNFDSITSLDSFDYGVFLDMDGSAGEFAHRDSSSQIDVLSQEFRFRSDTDASLQWLAGAEFSRERFREGRDLLLRDNFLVINELQFTAGSVAYDQDTDMMALYGSLSWQFDERLQFNASLRYTDEDKKYRDGVVYVPTNPPFYLLQGVNRDYSLDSRLSGSLGLNWQLNENMMVYGTVSRGFKSGGFFGGFYFTDEELAPYEEELITAWELGIKSEFPDQNLRLNGSVFYYDYRDVQSFVTRVNSLTNTSMDMLANPADARHSGAELELTWAPASGFQFIANLAYLDAEFKNASEAGVDLFGQPDFLTGQRPYAPRFSGNMAIVHQTRAGADYRVTSALDYNYRTDFSGYQPNPVEEALNELPGYGLFNARVSVGNARQSWEISVWVRNLLDERYRTRVKSDGLQGYAEMYGLPRHFGATVSYQW